MNNKNWFKPVNVLRYNSYNIWGAIEAFSDTVSRLNDFLCVFVCVRVCMYIIYILATYLCYQIENTFASFSSVQIQIALLNASMCECMCICLCQSFNRFILPNLTIHNLPNILSLSLLLPLLTSVILILPQNCCNF